MGRSRDIATILSANDISNRTTFSFLDSSDVLSISGGGGGGGGGSGLVTYQTLDSLPSSGLSEGDQAFIASARRLYVSDGGGWYSVAVANAAPYWDSTPAAAYTIVDSQTPLVVTALPLDSDNPLSHLTNQSFASDSAQYMVDITIDSSVFTFTPKSKDSIGQEVAAGNLTDSNGDFTYTFKWTDGVSVVTAPSIITYNPSGPVFGDPVYIARYNNLADESSSFPGSVDFMSGTWTHNGGNCDVGSINISGSGQYQLYSISMGKRTGSISSIPTMYLRVWEGTSTGGTVVSAQSITYPSLADTTANYQCQELIYPEPVTLERGTTYTVGYAFLSTDALTSTSGAGTAGAPYDYRTTYNISSSNGGGTLTLSGGNTFAGPDPFDTSNGTNINGANGQLPVFGFKFPN